MSKRKIIPQMFDIRPVDETGDLDWKKINSVGGYAFEKKEPNDYINENCKISPLEEVLIVEKESLEKRIETLEFELVNLANRNKNENEELRSNLERRIAELENEKINLSKEKSVFEADVQNEKRRLLDIEQEKKILENERLELVNKSVFLQEKVLEMESANKREDEKNKEVEFKSMQAQLEMERERLAEMEWEKNNLELEKESFLRRSMILENKLAEIEMAREEERRQIEKEKNSPSQIWKILGKNKDSLFEQEDFFSANRHNSPNGLPVFAFAAITFLLVVLIGGVSFFYKGMGIKGRVLGISKDGYESVSRAIASIGNKDFVESSRNFEEAFGFFSEASEEIDKMGEILNEGSRFFPYISKISSGKNLLETGKHLSLAGKYLNEALSYFNGIKSEDSLKNGEISMLDVIQKTESMLKPASEELRLAEKEISQIKVEDLPEDIREKFLILKENLPKIISSIDTFSENSNAFSDILGANGPRKYLFLFQNNNEIRATGGFIGSYGLLDVSEGRVRNFFIDGIFNPDGQLVEKIVPPSPIQKISAAWSMHDSNWFPNFPTSAEKAILFYEKTGGPTADGVISMTPTVMEKLLAITGPIEMEEYGIVLDSVNFVEKTQDEVESKGQENLEKIKKKNKSLSEEDEVIEEPKKILADLAPKVLDKIFNSGDQAMMLKATQAIMEGLAEKHILIYAKNEDIQALVSERGWSGEILNSQKDYLSVINTNINGYKTDGVVDEKISHKVNISAEGTITNTVSITRKHNGGNTEYEWWNKVNADYMRVYVPLGSRLIRVDGQTREINEPPLEYEKLGFKNDPDVQREEGNMIIDQETGTRIYEENSKTVFANWIYVSPQEEATVTYEYELPFKLFEEIIRKNDSVGAYSLLVQKQSGSRGSTFESEINFPKTYSIEWKTPIDLKTENGIINFSGTLSSDKFQAVVFKNKKN